jgi:hypothetical protein
VVSFERQVVVGVERWSPSFLHYLPDFMIPHQGPASRRECVNDGRKKDA